MPPENSYKSYKTQLQHSLWKLLWPSPTPQQPPPIKKWRSKSRLFFFMPPEGVPILWKSFAECVVLKRRGWMPTQRASFKLWLSPQSRVWFLLTQLFYQWPKKKKKKIRLEKLNHTPTNQRLNDIEIQWHTYKDLMTYIRCFIPASNEDWKKIKIKHMKWQCNKFLLVFIVSNWLSLVSDPIHAHSRSYFYSFIEAT